MPSALTYPGVYIEEVPSGVRTITGVSTSVAAFVGFFKRGSTKSAVQVFSFSDFTREFGGLDPASEASYAIHQFFLNGGTEAWVVRAAAAGSSVAAAISLKESVTAANAILKATARSAGKWGNALRVTVDYDTSAPGKTFNLTVTELVTVGDQVAPGPTEVFRNLVLDPTKSNDAKNVVNDGSKLIELDYPTAPAPGQRPAHSGTVGGPLTTGVLGGITAADTMNVSLNEGPSLGTVTVAAAPGSAASLAADLTTKLRSLTSELKHTTVTALGSAPDEQYMRILPGSATDDVLSFTGPLATKLGLEPAKANLSQYTLGGVAKAAQALPGAAVQKGIDGDPPTGGDLIGDAIAKTGLHRLDAVDLFNLLCVPDTMNLPDSEAAAVATAAETYCEARRAFYLLDVPQKQPVRDEVAEIKVWIDQNSTLRHKNAAVYYPRPQVADPLNEFRLRLVPPSGSMAGLYARTDTERGVWKAPAGTEATLRGVQALERTLTDAENGTLNPKAINCLRRFPVHGNVSWGARTLVGADAQASEWKYIPVRRTALFIEESLFRGTQWVVFEPNDEPLWAQIRLNVGAFMHTLFRQGAFQGTTPRQAYFVKCDSETTTQTDINSGVVNIVVGFAPLKPAEFVVIKIQQMTGEIET